MCGLLTAGFPKSYVIDFKSPAKAYLPIKKLPQKGVNQLFANAVQYPALYGMIERYARLAINEFEWYNNLQDENCAMPGTFAVFALGLVSLDYVPLILHYLDLCDDEHSSIQEKFTAAFIEKFGFSDATLPVFINCALSMQWMRENKLYAAQMANAESLEALLKSKGDLERYVTEPLRYNGGERKRAAFYGSLWNTMLLAIWGKTGCAKQGAKIISGAPQGLKHLYEAVFTPF